MDWKAISNNVLLAGLFAAMVTTFNQINGRLDTMNERIDALQTDMNRRFDIMQAENRRQHAAMQEVLRVFEGRITRLEEKASIGPETPSKNLGRALTPQKLLQNHVQRVYSSRANRDSWKRAKESMELQIHYQDRLDKPACHLQASALPRSWKPSVRMISMTWRRRRWNRRAASGMTGKGGRRGLEGAQ